MKGNMPFIEGIISFSTWRSPNNVKEGCSNKQSHEWLHVPTYLAILKELYTVMKPHKIFKFNNESCKRLDNML